jgi:hypothetical protein
MRLRVQTAADEPKVMNALRVRHFLLDPGGF